MPVPPQIRGILRDIEAPSETQKAENYYDFITIVTKRKTHASKIERRGRESGVRTTGALPVIVAGMDGQNGSGLWFLPERNVVKKHGGNITKV